MGWDHHKDKEWWAASKINREEEEEVLVPMESSVASALLLRCEETTSCMWKKKWICNTSNTTIIVWYSHQLANKFGREEFFKVSWIPMADEFKGQNKLNKFQQYVVTAIQAMFLISPKKKKILFLLRFYCLPGHIS